MNCAQYFRDASPTLSSRRPLINLNALAYSVFSVHNKNLWCSESGLGHPVHLSHIVNGNACQCVHAYLPLRLL